MVMVMPGEAALLKLLRGGKLTGLSGTVKHSGQLVQLIGLRGVPLTLCGIRFRCQLLSDVRHHLRELGGILLLQLLQLAQKIGNG